MRTRQGFRFIAATRLPFVILNEEQSQAIADEYGAIFFKVDNTQANEVEAFLIESNVTTTNSMYSSSMPVLRVVDMLLVTRRLMTSN